MNLRERIKKDLRNAVAQTIGRLGKWDGGMVGGEDKTEVARSADARFGDYTTNIAMKLGRDSKPFGKAQSKPFDRTQGEQSPMDFAKNLAGSLKNQPYAQKLEVKEPGFINFFIKPQVLQKEVESLLNKKTFDSPFTSKKVAVEFTDPNPFKDFHVGHLYSNSIGESISRLMEVSGAKVMRANYQGDVGLHVAKCIWGIRKILSSGQNLADIAKKPLAERVDFLGTAYATGASAYEQDAKAKEEITKLNKEIYKKLDAIDAYKLGKKWSLENFEAIYKRLGTHFDFYYFESEVGSLGVEIVRKNVGKVFVESQGAIIFPGEKYGLHNRVFITSAGLPTYEAKELGLAFKKYADFPFDQSVIVTGSEILDYFKVLMRAIGQIDPKLAEKTRHVAHGMVRMPGGKISSRLGNVISAEHLLDEAKKRALELVKQKGLGEKAKQQAIAEQIAVGAVKYAFLKGNPAQDIKFSFEEALTLEGNSGPYLQYTYARCRSVTKKGRWVGRSVGQRADFSGLAREEDLLLRTLAHFEEVVVDAAGAFAPNQVTNFLFELAQKYNTLYNNLRIIDAKEPDRSRRLFLTEATSQVLKKGLDLLGIEAPEKM